MKTIYIALVAAATLSLQAQISDGTSNTLIISVPDGGSTLALLGLGGLALLAIKRKIK
jgi:hypothetical protein